MTCDQEQITRLLQGWSNGDKSALDELMPIVYEQLHKLAMRCMRSERRDHTLRATALVHEAYVRLVKSDVSFRNRAHFYAVSARLLRRILVDHARTLHSEKRGSPAVASSLIDLGTALDFEGDFPAAELQLHQALDLRSTQLSAGHPDLIAAEVRLGGVLIDEHKYEEAEPLLQRASLAAQQSPFPLLPWQVAEADMALGACLVREGKLADGQKLIRQSEGAVRSDPHSSLRRRSLSRAGIQPGEGDRERFHRTGIENTQAVIEGAEASIFKVLGEPGLASRVFFCAITLQI